MRFATTGQHSPIRSRRVGKHSRARYANTSSLFLRDRAASKTRSRMNSGASTAQHQQFQQQQQQQSRSRMRERASADCKDGL